MATRDLAALLPLAESIADGSPIDWDAAEAQAAADDRAIVRQLRILANLAVLHRSLPADPDTEATSPTASIGERATTAPAIGSWAHLALIERLGGGTFGEVYRAWDRHLEREVALKLLRASAPPERPEAVEGPADAPVDDLQVSRIATEGRLLARVHHQNVITVHGVAVHDQRVGLWMELVRGATLEQLLQKRGPFSAREAALVGIDLCRALAAIHAAGLVHRDVKAQNVMREDGGRIVLMDLGTGREIDPNRRYALPDLAGTPLYLAPEIFDGATASERTDLYSLGVLLYHLVTGSFPTRATTIAELREGHAQGSGVRLRDARADLPTAFVTVVDRSIARDPDRRYASAGELEADLVQALDDTGIARTPAATPAPQTADDSARPSPWWRPRLAAAVVAAALILTAVGWPAYRAYFPPAIRSIAVLPLANMSGDRSQDYFADAMTDELIGTLGQLGGLTVISRTSVMQFKGSTKSVPEIVETLKVDAVLESSFMLVPGKPVDGPGAKRVRINARLIRAGSDTPLWNESFEEVVSDLLALQGRVARKVAEGIDLRLTSKQLQGTLAATRRQNVQAQEEHFQGRYLLNKLSRDNLVLARDYLERAVRIDPTYARAYASLAQCYRYLDLYGVLSRSEAAPLTLDAARTALRLDDSLPEAHNLLADAAFLYQWDWTAAEREYRRAIELNPSYGFARSEYARFLMAEDRLDEALEQARLAETNDPLSAEASGVVALALYYQHHYDDAITARRRALQLDPASPQQYLGLGRTYAQKGEFDQAIAALKEAVARSGRAPFMMAELARTYAVAGRRDEAQAIMTTLTATDGGGSHLSAQYHTYVYAALGDYDLAFEWLDKAFAEREQNVLWARVDPRFDRLRGDPRFDAYIRRVPPRP